MEKQIPSLKVEQVFFKQLDGQNLLRRLMIYDDDIAYDAIFDAKKLTQLRLMAKSQGSVFYEIASKTPEKVCERKYYESMYAGVIYNERRLADKSETMVALAHCADGTVRGGAVFSMEMKGLDVFRGEGKWASFILTPKGVQYVYDPEVQFGSQSNSQQDKPLCSAKLAVMIDGKEMQPVVRKTENTRLTERRGGRN